MTSNDIIEENYKEHIEMKTKNINDTRKRRKGYETFCDMLSGMTNEELKVLAKKKMEQLKDLNLTLEQKQRIKGELNRIAQEYRIPNRIVNKNKKEKWFEDYGFIISYGAEGTISPIGDIVTYQKLELYNGSLEIEQYNNLSDEDKKQSLQAVFSNKKGDLVLRIPVGSLMELRDIIEEYATHKLSEDVISSGISSEIMGAIIESISIVDGETKKTILGNNYNLYPSEYQKDKEIELLKEDLEEIER